MKKNNLITALIFLQSIVIYSQNNYMDNISEKSCECISQITEGKNLLGTELGLCIINEATKYKDELLRDHNINMDNIDVEGEVLGKIIALEMFTKCPEQMKRIAIANDDNNSEKKESYLSIEGNIKSVFKNEFIIFSLITSDNKTSKFYWLTFIQSDNDLQNEYKSFEGKNVIIEYSNIELFDHNLNEYRNYNLIESLNILN
jgi:hypothetical protein